VNDEATHDTSAYEEQEKRLTMLQEAGGMISLPVTRGGIALSMYKSIPYILTDVTKSAQREFRYDGQLNYWTWGGGVQVAPSAALGGAVSLIHGERTSVQKEIDPSGNLQTSKVKDSYKLGYEIRVGGMYSYQNMVHAGIRFVLPARIPFEQRRIDTPNAYVYEGELKTSYTSAFGVAVDLPYFSLSAQGNARFPYDYVVTAEDIDSKSLATYFSVGMGAGCDVFLGSFVLSGGYTWDEFDPFLFVYDYDDFSIAWEENNVKAENGVHTISTGARYLFRNDMIVTLSIENRFYELLTRKTLSEHYRVTRVTGSLSFRF
jgi:hypothetical protein